MFVEPDLNAVLSKPAEIENLARFIAERKKPESFCLSFEEWNRRDTPAWSKRDLTSSDPTKTGFFLVNERIPDVLDALRPVSLIGQVPMQVISGLTAAVRIPRVATGTTGSTAIEYGSSATVSESDPTFGSAGGLRPLRISTVVKYSRQLLAQAGGQGLSQMIKTDIARGIAQQMDQQIISGTGMSNGQAVGILSQASGSSVSANFTFGAAQTSTSWAKYLIAVENMEAAFVQPSHWLIGPVTAQKGRNLIRGTGQALFLYHPDATSDAGFATERIAKYPVIMTPYLATFENVLLGQWNLCYILVWGNGIEIIVDPYSAAATGEIQITGNLMWNFCIRHPAAVAISTDSGAQ